MKSAKKASWSFQPPPALKFVGVRILIFIRIASKKRFRVIKNSIAIADNCGFKVTNGETVESCSW
jgi:hypothetical protein